MYTCYWGVSHQVSVYLAKQLQRRRFLKIDQPETRMACGSHVCKRIRTKLAIFIEDLPYTVKYNRIDYNIIFKYYTNELN
jgi:hypothetical protein